VRFWEENRKLAKGLGVALLALLAAKFLVVNWQARATGQDVARYKKLSDTLKSQRKGVYDVADAVTALKRSSEGLDAEVKGLMKRVEIPFHPWTKIPPAYEASPGAYFMLKHAEQRAELYLVCQVGSEGRATELSDPTLGFGDILGKPLNNKQAQENLNRLSIVVRLVKLLAQSGVVEIVKISPGEPVKTGPADYAPIMREYPVNIQVKTRIDPLMKFLHSVRKPGEFFLVVRGLDVRGSSPYGRKNRPAGKDENELTVSITAAGMRFFTEEERKAAPKPKGKRPRKGAPRKWKKALGA
jgi:hypothetical protein